MSSSSISYKVKVLDAEICSKCKYLHIMNAGCQEIWADGKIITTTEPYMYCDNIKMCEYLQKLFASKSTPKVEEAKSDP